LAVNAVYKITASAAQLVNCILLHAYSCRAVAEWFPVVPAETKTLS